LNKPQDQGEEPVAYLGGQSGARPEDAPIEGYLGGDAPPDSLPALPPAAASYSATDFMPAQEAPQENYADYANEPVEAPAEDATQYEQYGHEEQATAPEDYAADGTQTVPEVPPQEQSSEFDDPGLPKTISQQDAENIIKRITTKKILPPEVAAAEGPRINPPAEFTPRSGPKLGRIVFVLVVVLGGVGAAVFFKDDLKPYVRQYLPKEVGDYIYGEEPPPKNEERIVTKQQWEIDRDAMQAKLLEAEWRALGYESAEAFNKDQKDSEGEKKTPGPTTSDPTATGTPK